MAPGKTGDFPDNSGSGPVSSSKEKDGRLPVTLLSGFLGSGKTTLLEHILTSPDHRLRIGVIVNDIGELNIDAALLANHNVTRKEEQVVSMQNGCICCTLRGDLLEEVARLADEKQVDYLVIESSGVSEPMQVAETFSEELAEQHITAGHDLEQDPEGQKAENKRIAEILKAGGLSKISRLDTCVTVVDARNFMDDFDTPDFLNNRQEDVPEEDDRNISDLQVDQIEFADVIIINKCDLVSKDEVEKIKAVIERLNMGAKVLTTVRGKLDVSQIIDTKLFSFEKATMNAGWLKSLTEEHTPETIEYGVGHFVYRARRPFHPLRLFETIKSVFVVMQPVYQEDAGEENDDEDEDGEDNEDNDDNAEDDEEDEEEEEEEEEEEVDPAQRLRNKRASETFRSLLRSKGFMWLATRPRVFGEWSQSGVMLTIGGADLWRCEIPENEWPDNPKVRKAFKNDYEGKWADRRQEIVFIGHEMRNGAEARIRKAFDDCLLTDKEFSDWEKAMESSERQEKLDQLFEDGFEEWPDFVPVFVEEDGHAGHSHAGHSHNDGHHAH